MKRILFTALVTLCGVFAIWYGSRSNEISTPKADVTLVRSATILNPAKPIVDFSLTDTEGKIFTQSSLWGHWTLMFFGYAQCPDICPRTLTTITEVWSLLPPSIHKNDKLRFIFVSLDPKSDTAESLKSFLNRFNPSFRGLTGDEAIIQKLSKACSIYSWQDPNTKLDGPKVIDHSATLLLINPQGQIQALFSPPHQKENIANDLQTILKS